MEQTSSPPNLFKHAARMGAIGGGIGILFTILIYVADIRLMADWKVGIFFILFYLGYVIYAGIQFRKESGGYLSYGKAFQHGYVTLIVGGFISTLFTILLFHVIDPSIPETLTQASIEKTEEMLAGFGMSADQVEEAMDKAREDIPARFSVVGQLTQLGWGLLVNALIAVITSLFVRKNQPEML